MKCYILSSKEEEEEEEEKAQSKVYFCRETERSCCMYAFANSKFFAS